MKDNKKDQPLYNIVKHVGDSSYVIVRGASYGSALHIKALLEQSCPECRYSLKKQR